MRVRTHYYQQFDADFSREVPEEGYGGWQVGEVELDPARTAVVVMHAWDCGSCEEYPGWWRACAEIPQTYAVAREVFPPLLAAVRRSRLALFHVVGGRGYYEGYPGWRRTVELAGEGEAPLPQVERDATYEALQKFRAERVFPGAHNQGDVDAGWARVGFLAEAEPQGEEGVARDGAQLFALCREAGVNHLLYCGFNVDWCLLMSPGGMVDMSRRGAICSVIRDAVTAVENRETAREELGKQMGLWRVSVGFGFVFDSGDLCAALGAEARQSAEHAPAEGEER